MARARGGRARAGWRGQNAILDRGLSGILATVAVIGVLGCFYLYSSNSGASAQVAQVSALTRHIATLYRDQQTFADITGTVIARAGALPPNWVAVVAGSPTLISVAKAPIALAPATSPTGIANDSYSMTIDRVSLPVCMALATANFGVAEYRLDVNANSNAPASPPASATPVMAQGWCNRTSNTVVLYFRSA